MTIQRLPTADVEHKHSPVGFVVEAEVVHVAARRGVLSVSRLSRFGIRNLQQIPMILHDKLVFLERSVCENPSSFPVDTLHLMGNTDA